METIDYWYTVLYFPAIVNVHVPVEEPPSTSTPSPVTYKPKGDNSRPPVGNKPNKNKDKNRGDELNVPSGRGTPGRGTSKSGEFTRNQYSRFLFYAEAISLSEK